MLSFIGKQFVHDNFPLFFWYSILRNFTENVFERLHYFSLKRGANLRRCRLANSFPPPVSAITSTTWNGGSTSSLYHSVGLEFNASFFRNGRASLCGKISKNGTLWSLM